MKEKIYVVSIVCSFDADYHAKAFRNYDDALIYMNKVLNEEIEIIKKESCFENPDVFRWTEDYVTLVYNEGFTEEDYYETEWADYRVFEVEI